MADAVRILMLEDTPADAELNERCLRRAGFDFTSLRVETRRAFSNALCDFEPDLILADYSLPLFDGIAALQAAKEVLPDTPVIIVTGAIGEEMAVACMQLRTRSAGASSDVQTTSTLRARPSGPS